MAITRALAACLLVAGLSGCANSADTMLLENQQECPKPLRPGTTCNVSRFYQVMEPNPPMDWWCETADELDSHRRIVYYADDQGHVGFFYEWERYPEPVHQMGRSVIESDGRIDIVDFGPESMGFVRFPGTYTGGTITTHTYGLAANGTPRFLDTYHLRPIPLDNPDGVVYAWKFTSPEGVSYNFTTRFHNVEKTPGFHLEPEDFIVQGTDFYLDARVHPGIETTHRLDLADRGPDDLLRPRPGCERELPVPT